MRYLKIFGERNSGTTWLEALARRNLQVSLLLITAEDVRNNFTGKGSDGFEADMDAYFATDGRVNFGWKHKAVSIDSLRADPKFADTVFIFLVKNPYWFVRSLWKHPYNAKAAYAKRMDLDRFAQTPWPLLGRDELGPGQLANPFALWSGKVASYVETLAELPQDRAVLLRYEDLLRDAEHELRRVAAQLGLAHGAEFRPFELDTKIRSAQDVDYYREKYLTENYRDYFSDASLDAAALALDPELLARLDYPLVLSSPLRPPWWPRWSSGAAARLAARRKP